MAGLALPSWELALGAAVHAVVGEFEISAWEIGAGCGDFHAAWVLNLSGMTGGLLTAPVRMVLATAPVDMRKSCPFGERA